MVAEENIIIIYECTSCTVPCTVTQVTFGGKVSPKGCVGGNTCTPKWKKIYDSEED